MDKELRELLKCIVVAVFLVGAIRVGAATIENTPLLTSPLKGSDRVPAGRAGQATANTANMDQMAAYAQGKYSSNTNTRFRNLSTQVDGKQNTLLGDVAGHYHSTDRNRTNHTGTQAATTIVEDSTRRFTTDAEKSTWNAKQNTFPNATTLSRFGAGPTYNGSPIGSGSGGHVIEDEGVALTQRTNMNFTGAGVTASDIGGKTVVNIPGGGGVSDFNNRTGSVDPAEGDYSLTLLADVILDTPLFRQFIAYNGTSWVNKTVTFSDFSSVFGPGSSRFRAYTTAIATALSGKEPANSNIQTHIGTTGTPHVTSGEKSTWNGKQDALGYTPVSNARQTAYSTARQIDLAGKAPLSHTQAISTITGLQTTLNNHSTAINLRYKSGDSPSFGTVTADAINVPQGANPSTVDIYEGTTYGGLYKAVLTTGDISQDYTWKFLDKIYVNDILYGGGGADTFLGYSSSLLGTTRSFAAHAGAGGSAHSDVTSLSAGFMTPAQLDVLNQLNSASTNNGAFAENYGAVCNGAFKSMSSAGYHPLSLAKSSFSNISTQIINVQTQSIDWAGIQSAIRDAEATKGTAVIGEGQCVLSESLTVKVSGLIFKGLNKAKSILALNFDGPAIVSDGTAINDLGFADFSIYGQPTASMGIYGTKTSSVLPSAAKIGILGGSDGNNVVTNQNNNWIIQRVNFYDLGTDIYLRSNAFNRIDQCYFTSFLNGVKITNTGNADWGDNHITNNVFAGSLNEYSDGIWQNSSGGTRLINNKIINGHVGYEFTNSIGATGVITVVGNSFETYYGPAMVFGSSGSGSLHDIRIAGGNEIYNYTHSQTTKTSTMEFTGNVGDVNITGNTIRTAPTSVANKTIYFGLTNSQPYAISANHFVSAGDIIDYYIKNTSGTNPAIITMGANSPAEVDSCAKENGACGTNFIFSNPAAGSTVGAIQYGGTTNRMTESANLLWDATNNELEVTGKIGIGTATPGTTVDIYGTTIATQLRIRDEVTSSVSGGGALLYHNNASNTLPSAGDRLGYFLFGGLDGSTTRNAAFIGSYAPLSWSTGTSWPAELRFETVETNSRVERMKIMHNGNVTTGTGQTVGRTMTTTYGGHATLFQNISSIGKGRVVQRDYGRDNYVRQTRGSAAVGNLVPIGVVYGGYSSVGVATTCKAGGYCWIATTGRAQAYVNTATNCGTEGAFVYALGSGSGVAACDATNHADAAYHNAEIGQPLTSTATSNLIDIILHFNFATPAGFSIWASIRRRKELQAYWEGVLK